jgi:signal transduction histidine kinase/DNA-binding response OmpR family regulator
MNVRLRHAGGGIWLGLLVRPLRHIFTLWLFALVASFVGPVARAQGFGEGVGADRSEVGRPLLRHFAARDYGAHHQMWVGVEDALGLPHFGNRGCVLEFDGVEWLRIEVPGTTFVRGLALGPDGKVYVGAVDELGYIEADPLGGKRFVSLRDRLPAEYREFGDIWRTVATKDGVFFAAGRKVFRWHAGAFQVWEFPGDASVWLHVANDRVYIHRRGEALQRFADGKFVPFCDDPFVRRNRLPVVLGGGFMSGLLLVSADGGCARVDESTGQLTPWPTDADAWMRREGVQTAANANGLLVVASRQAGLVVLNPAGRFVRRFDEADGLRDPQVKNILPSRSGQMWLAHNNGITRVSMPFSYTLFAREQGLDGTTTRAITRFAGQIHVATGRGVFRLEAADAGRLSNARFTVVPGFRGSYFSLLGTEAGLFAGENEGLQFLPTGATEPIPLTAGPSVVMLAASRVAGRVWAGALDGVMRLDRQGDGRWAITRPPEALRLEARSLIEEDDGTVWLGTFTRGVVRVRRIETAEPEVTFFRANEGLPAGHGAVQVRRAGDHVLAVCASGEALRFDATQQAFVPLPAQVPFRHGEREGRTWMLVPGRDGQPDALRYVGPELFTAEIRLPDVFSAAGPVQGLFAEPRLRVVWAAGADGLARIDFEAPFPLVRPPGVALRSAVLDGGKPWPADFALPAGAHQVDFRFRASAYATEAVFSTRLEGLEDQWTPWSKERGRSFSHLPPGRYALHVQTGNGSSRGIPARVFAFSIAAPWWASWWAMTGGGLLFVGAMAGLVGWRVRALRARSAQLEATVAARTRELEANREQLVIARDAADAANRAKSTFLAHMSHELRTPLNGILGYAQVLARDPAQPEPTRERLQVIIRSGEHLLTLINDVLDLARVEAGQLHLRAADFSPAQLARGVAEIVRARCEEKQLTFDVRLAPGLPRLVRTDEQKLRQVLLNLLGNAVKFTERGRVALEIAPAADGRVRFLVEDTGRGIAPEQIPLLFQPFATTEERETGTGLGLALSRSMVELLGGRIQVASELGHGTRFWFDLPLPEVGSASPQETPVRERIVGFAGGARRLLVVDDDATNRAVLRELLVPLGFAVSESADGLAALGLARAERPHAVLLDLRFPNGLDGLTIAREMRAEPALAATKIFAVSASVFESDRHQAFAAGCDAFLAKPFKDEQLFALLETHLGLKWLRAGADVNATVPTAEAEAAPLPAEARASLLELARRGDVLRLRARLAELGADPRFATEIATLDALAASYQMKRLREVLSSDVEDHPDRR